MYKHINTIGGVIGLVFRLGDLKKTKPAATDSI